MDRSIGPATREAALAKLARIEPDAYARTRNHLNGAVTMLSPYLTHGVIGMRELLAFLQRAHALPSLHKLVFELGWREFFRHCWRHDGDDIFGSLRAGPLPEAAYARKLPPDVREGRTGLAVIDLAVRSLYDTGYLHNHARLWLASYVIHWRKVHWRAGADWMWSHLLDGDLASNHLSWQWVAGTASAKPYLFNAENVRRHAPFEWHVDGSVLDVGYAHVERVARDARATVEPAMQAPGIGEPDAGITAPPTSGFTAPCADQVRDRDVWLVHPWCLRDPPPGSMAVAVLDADFHRRRPWSLRRWHWIAARMATLTECRWVGEPGALASALRAARRVSGVADPHLGAWSAAFPLDAPQAIWPEPGRRQHSFSSWWARVQPHTPVLNTPR